MSINTENKIDINNFPVSFSEKALAIVSNAIKSKNRINKILRISIEGGGCSGFKYGLNFIENADENDILCEYAKDINIVIDINTYSCIKNTVIDFVKTDNKSGFTFNNPNAANACNGCD
jgi:iron-sulfur cluster assembly protein